MRQFLLLSSVILSGLVLLMAFTLQPKQQNIFLVSSGQVSFHSKARLELISAISPKLKGAVDVSKNTFAFSIEMTTFEGFNSPLQREHFNENYMESKKYPIATFSGRIIEEYDLSKEGVYQVRAKGKFSVHGIEQERIIPATVTVKNNSIKLKTQFTVLLIDHDIKIPKIVDEKLSSEILVNISATLSAK